MKPFDSMNTTTARLFILVILAFCILYFIPTSRFLYTGVQDAFEPGSSRLRKKLE